MKKKLYNFDYTLLFMIIFIFAFGLVMLYSTSAYAATLKRGDSLYYLKRQCFAAALGFVLMFILANLDYHRWIKYIPVGYVGSLILCTAVIFVGTSLNNSSRWLRIGGISFQPSELAKVVIILYMANLVSRSTKAFRNFKSCAYALATIMPIFAVVAYNNLSTAVIIMGIAFAMVFIAYPKYWKFFILLLGAALMVVLFISLQGYRSSRIDAWMHPENYISGKGFQTLQGLYAIGSGGLFGKGLGGGLQKFIVPEAENDMIFSIIVEELGIFGAVCVMLMYILLLFRLVYIANRAKDIFGSYICIGIMIHIALQVIMNIAVVTNSMPNTGVTLPFISYGGTSIVILLAEFGLALNVSKQMDLEDVVLDGHR